MKLDKLPKSVNILGKEAEVILKRMNAHEGLFCPTTWTITINPSLSLKNRFHALFHEVGHAILQRANLSHSISEELEESIVELFAIYTIEEICEFPE